MPKTDNRTVGGRFEQEFAELLAKHGFWAHVMQQNKAGQPSDIIAVKGKFHTLIDCKVISNDKGFPFEHIQDNQRLAMRLFQRRCGDLCYFALKFPEREIRMVSLERLETLKNRGKKCLSEKDLDKETWHIDEWLKASDEWGKDL